MLKHAAGAFVVSLSVLAAVACGGSVGSSNATSDDEALSVCATGSTLKGIDVSYYQQAIDWQAVKSSGHAFAFIRVSDGTRFDDPRFEENWQSARDAGVLRGAYQYFRPSEDPVAQANLLLQKVGTLEAGDLPPVLDVETTDGVSTLHLQQRVHTWLQTIEDATGRKPLVYTMAGMSGSIGASFTDYPLWVANWGASCPRMPSAWKGWRFWQSSDHGTVAGIREKVDLDVFNGTLADLKAFVVETGGGEVDAGTPDADDVDAGDDDAGDLGD